MKNTVTISISIPTELASDLDMLAEDLKISRSSVTTAIISLVLNWYSRESKNALLKRFIERGGK